MRTREADYPRFARDLRLPFSNNPADQAIYVNKLRIKISGCMRGCAWLAGAQPHLAGVRRWAAAA
jgi:sulfite reductase beta subunit-like hemoprotein